MTKTQTDRQTDHATSSVAVARILCSACDATYNNVSSELRSRQTTHGVNWSLKTQDQEMTDMNLMRVLRTIVRRTAVYE